MVDVVSLLSQVALWIVLILIAFAVFGLIRGAIAKGASDWGAVAVAAVFVLLGVFLLVLSSAFLTYAILLILGGTAIVLLDAWSDRRANRKARARLRA